MVIQLDSLQRIDCLKGDNMLTNELIQFRLFKMPCCQMLICWVNPRTPNYCPECGQFVFTKLKNEVDNILVNDLKARLRYHI